MIAEDWYGVKADVSVSTRVSRLSRLIDDLDEADMEIVESLLRRLTSKPRIIGVEAKS
jgi:hypothetical protein